MIILFTAIVLGFAANALMDGIAFTKSPQGRDLNILWHAAKYLWVATILTAGFMIGSVLSVFGMTKLILVTIPATVLGSITWFVTYKIYRKIDWPDWA